MKAIRQQKPSIELIYTSKNKKFLDYNSLIRDNLLNVVKHALGKTSDYGLIDGLSFLHYFYN